MNGKSFKSSEVFGQQEPIAIIGGACRFVKSNTFEEFWKVLNSQEEVIEDVPASRWDKDKYYSPNISDPGKMVINKGTFIDKIEFFDNSFFGMSPREAMKLDPQQRLLLEVSWEAVENANIAPKRIRGTNGGVFFGISANSDYFVRMQEDMNLMDRFAATGGAHCFSAGRVGQLFDFHGPGTTVDTASSAGMTAFHYACQSLRWRESDICLAGGAKTLLAPGYYIASSQSGFVSPSQRVKVFDEKADGIIFAEGCGVLVLKRLSDALADGDNLLAIVRSTALKLEGDTSALMVPKAESQMMVYNQALGYADLEPEDVSYIETHGTGTTLGDPVEVDGLMRVYCKNRDKKNKLVLGGVKSVIGHCEAASGFASLTKVILCIQHGHISPQRNLTKLNPKLHIDDFPVVIPTSTIPWEPLSKKRIAAVNSTGFSGTCVHAILEEPDRTQEKKRPRTTVNERPHLLCLSAKSASALKELANRYISLLDKDTQFSNYDLAFGSSVGRNHFGFRKTFEFMSRADLKGLLNRFVHHEDSLSPVERQENVASGLSVLLADLKGINAPPADFCGINSAVEMHWKSMCESIEREMATKSIREENRKILDEFATQCVRAHLIAKVCKTPIRFLTEGLGVAAGIGVVCQWSLNDSLHLLKLLIEGKRSSPRIEQINAVVEFVRRQVLSKRIQDLTLFVNNKKVEIEDLATRKFWQDSLERTGHNENAELPSISGPTCILGTSNVESGLDKRFQVPNSMDMKSWSAMLKFLAVGYEYFKYEIAWEEFYDRQSANFMLLPNYPFQRKKFWYK